MSEKASYVRSNDGEKPIEKKVENEYLEELEEIQMMDSIRHPEKKAEDEEEHSTNEKKKGKKGDSDGTKKNIKEASSLTMSSCSMKMRRRARKTKPAV